jgi:hypothetical protein
MGDKEQQCWDQVAGGYLTPNTRKSEGRDDRAGRR